ncbi:TorD/DmsD family molecular chaperone [Candidatus Palauibacter sp.]|uniref:TorD/DmsD family molecular chaperone n=1 Tax=Candidatus Palauibacter sp. TaxID=3101350 RepID=UPI003B5BC311
MELFRALGALLDAPCSENRLIGHLLELGSVPDEPTHNELFLFQIYPYASAFLGTDGRLGGDARDRVAGFWRALETDPPPEPDHLRALLGGYAALIEAEQEATGRAVTAWRDARRAFLWEHMLSWVLPFLAKLRQIAPPFYRRWADTLEALLSRESAHLGPPTRHPLAFRESSPVPDPRTDGSTGFMSALLSPVRSGLVLTRADLARATRDLGLGLRVGERAYILRSMMSQGPRATLGWLAREAREWAHLHDRAGAAAPEVADFWTERAHATSRLLDALRADVVRPAEVFDAPAAVQQERPRG